MFILGLTPDVIMTLHQLDQYADLNIAQRISTLPGDGQVVIFGEQKYAQTVQLNPAALVARGIGMADVATAISNNMVEQPVGTLQGTHQAYRIGANSQLLQVDALSKVIVAIAMVRQCASASRSGGRRLRPATAARLATAISGK